MLKDEKEEENWKKKIGWFYVETLPVLSSLLNYLHQCNKYNK